MCEYKVEKAAAEYELDQATGYELDEARLETMEWQSLRMPKIIDSDTGEGHGSGTIM